MASTNSNIRKIVRSLTTTADKVAARDLLNAEIEAAKGSPAKAGGTAKTGKGLPPGQLRLALANLKRQGVIPAGISAAKAVEFGLMTAKGKKGPKAGDAKAAKAALAATGSRQPAAGSKSTSKSTSKATSKAKTRTRKAPVTSTAKSDQKVKKAGGTLTKHEWDTAFTTKVKTSGLMVGEKNKGTTLYRVVIADAMWDKVAGMRAAGATPNEAFGVVVEGTKARQKTGKERKAMQAARNA